VSRSRTNYYPSTMTAITADLGGLARTRTANPFRARDANRTSPRCSNRNVDDWTVGDEPRERRDQGTSLSRRRSTHRLEGRRRPGAGTVPRQRHSPRTGTPTTSRVVVFMSCKVDVCAPTRVAVSHSQAATMTTGGDASMTARQSVTQRLQNFSRAQVWGSDDSDESDSRGAGR
jgi:hypothetical protein